jgi:hypothetical protein
MDDRAPDAGARGGNLALVPVGHPSEATVAAWSRSGEDMEPSSKMVEMVRVLKESDASGDKTIVYSQCALPHTAVMHALTWCLMV